MTQTRGSRLRMRRSALLVAVPLFLAACGDSGDALVEGQPQAPAATQVEDGTGAAPAAPATPAAADGAGPSITISPETGSKDVGPTTRVKISSQNGPLRDVKVADTDGRVLSGAFDPKRTTWTASDPVRYESSYTVRAVAAGADGKPVVETSKFSTGKEPNGGRLNAISVKPSDGDTVGVAHPLAVGFDRPVKNKLAVQNALEVTTTPKVAGAWYWIDDYYVDYRPQNFWPVGTKVTLNAKLEGVGAGNGVSGQGSRKVSFTIGRSQIIKIDVDTKRLRVERGGKTIKTYEVSTGKKGWETRNGTKVLMDKETDKTWTNEEIDAEEEYREHSDYALRMTNSGEFIHDAGWNKDKIGDVNASHGCVGLYPKDMTWLFKNTMIGDPIIVTGSPKPYKDLINRYADWNIPWSKWAAGNAD